MNGESRARLTLLTSCFLSFSVAHGAQNSLSLTSGRNDGDSCGQVAVLLRNDAPVQGFSIAVCHDPTIVTLWAISVGPAADVFDFAATTIDPTVGGALSVIMDLLAPFDGQTIPPGESQTIAQLTYCCTFESVSPTRTPLEFCDGTVGTPLVDNIIVIGDESIGASHLKLAGGEFSCVPLSGFVRGDSTDDGVVNIADPIRIATTLFRSGPPFDCNDAADANNDTQVDVSDISYLANFLYSGGPAPPSPFPGCGPDSSSSLGCVSSDACE